MTRWASSTTDVSAENDPPRSNPQATEPSAWVVRFASGLPANARVLDIACGHGRQARWFARRGCHVTAVDVDPACAASLETEPGVEFLEVDLESGAWPFAGRQFDAVIVVHYLHRPMMPLLVDAVAPGGRLIYETFARGNEQFGRPRNPDFLLRPRELLEAFSELRIVAFEDGYVASPHPAMIQRIAAVRLEPQSSTPVEALSL